jgi:nicotinamidase-related amidase
MGRALIIVDYQNDFTPPDGALALDVLREGFSVRVDSTAVRGVDVEAGDSQRALDEVRAAGATVA